MNALPERIGTYTVEREVGRGGMGVVYLARDPRLDRAVAIKVIPDAFASDPERLARFEREARLLAALHHPNVAGIYGIEEEAGRRFLVLEYVEGETLAQRLDRGALPMDEAIDACRQIAAALEAAHDQGIIHRDLKPGNVKLTPAGEVKVLDFGLAKGDTASSVSSSDLSNSPTVTVGATGVGTILGTAAYMSPEQARGRTMDRRTDIWSLGCVLYECLTGRQAFAGETTSDMIARILQGEPEWAALPGRTPERVRVLLSRMLEKDARRRLRDAGDVRLELEEIHAALSSSSGSGLSRAAYAAPARRPAWVLPALALVAGAVIGFAAFRFTSPPRVDPVPAGTRLSVEIPENLRLYTYGLENASPVALRPDGSGLVIEVTPVDGPDADHNVLCVRDFNSTEFRVLPGTRGVEVRPRMSVDGRDVLFVATGNEGGRHVLYRVPVDGSAPPVQILELPAGWPREFVPLPDGRLLFLDEQQRLVRILPSGKIDGEPVVIRPDRPITLAFLDNEDGTAALDAKRVLIGATTFDAQGWSRNMLLVNLDTGAGTTVLRDAGHGRLLPDGDMLFSRGDVILRVPFDARSGEVSGEPVAVFGGIRTFGDFAPGRFETARNGTVVFGPGGRVAEARKLAIYDRNGVPAPWHNWAKAYNYNFQPSVSADGHWGAVTATGSRGIDEIWLSELGEPYMRRVVSTPDADAGTPVLSRDGQWLAFRLTGADSISGVYVRRTGDSGYGRKVLELGGRATGPSSWAPDGRALLAHVAGRGARDLVVILFPEGPDAKFEVTRLITDGQRNTDGLFSPDGAWVAFTSDRSGGPQAYVAPYRDGRLGAATPVLQHGVVNGWAGPGRLYCVDSSSVIKSVSLRLGQDVKVERVERLFDADAAGMAVGAPTPDGRIFGVMQTGEEFRVRRLEVVLDAFRKPKR